MYLLCICVPINTHTHIVQIIRYQLCIILMALYVFSQLNYMLYDMVRACPSYAAASCVTSQSPAAPDDGFSSSAGGVVGAVLRASPRPRSSVILFTDGAASSSAISEVRAVFLVCCDENRSGREWSLPHAPFAML